MQSAQGTFPGRIASAGKARRWYAAGLLAVLIVAGCAVRGSTDSPAYQSERASHLFAVGFQDVSEIYIEDVEISELAMAGLENLSSIDPEITIAHDGESVLINVKGTEAGRFRAPGPRDSDRWGGIAAATVNTGRKHSKQLASAAAEDVYEAVFNGLTAELDGFSRYAGREEARENRASRDGFGGIGVRIDLVDEGVKVLSVMENTPAETAGVQDGDVIVMIDGEAAAGLPQHEVVRKLRGPVRSKVALTISRDPRPVPLVIEVTRAHIVPQTVKYEVRGEIGYIKVSGFNQSTTRTLRRKIQLAKQQIGSRLKGFVVDLRSNPGGLLDQSVAVSDLFLDGGRIVSTHGRHPDSHQYFDAEDADLTEGLPVVVLINGNSASASEIVAAALQDAGRAVVIGSNSFGKGTVQTVLRLPNEGELTLTWARFHAPTGYTLNRRGVVPDICTSGNVRSVEDVMERLRSGLFPIDLDTQRTELDPSDDEGLEALRAFCPVYEGENELDLKVALELLTDSDLYARALHGSHADTAQEGRPGQLSAISRALTTDAR